MILHSNNIRAILMYYYRFKRQFICCSEVKTDCYELSDILVSSKKHMIEIEIKTSKQDLIKGEERKDKHQKPDDKRLINKFYLCVPTELVEDAKLWIAQVNPKYGLIEIISDVLKKDFFKYEYAIRVVFDAQILQPGYSNYLKDKMFKRLSSALTNEYLDKIK